MDKKTFARVTKTVAILLAVLFLVTTVSAYTNIGGEINDRNTIVIHNNKHRFGNHDDKYGQGYKDVYSKGSNDGKKDCNKYGSKETLNKIPDPTYKDKSYSRDFILGYTTGYNEKRYLCLQKINMLKK
jgi:hypothetical protein